MTTTQVDYWRYKEGQRHNVATETQARNELAETVRHNYVTEGETQRHNLVVEGETNRHNLVTEGISLKEYKERKRHNLVSEGQEDTRLAISAGELAEKKRHNTVSEGIESYKAETGRMDAETRKQRAAVQNALDKVRTEQGLYDLSVADIKLLSGLGDTGRKLGIAKYSEKEIKDNLQPAIQWVINGSPPQGYESYKPIQKQHIQNLKQAIEEFSKNFEHYSINMP